MNNAGFLNLNWNDFLKGFVVAIATAFITSLAQILESGHLPDGPQLKAAGIMAASAAAGYLLKNLLTNNKGQMFKTDVKEVE